MPTLPVDTVLPELKEILRRCSNTVLVAPPGAGKTTKVPLALMEEAWLEGRRIVMLEPRRLAARAAARYMAALLGEQVGDTIGYRVRLDTKVGPGTRVEVITEGVLTRLLQTDPAIENVGLIIFDEFHERSLQADLGLALCLQSQAVLRDDLRILVMSATLDAEPVANILGNAPIIKCAGRAFPVETRHLEQPLEGRIEAEVARRVLAALDKEQGDILVFLPGAGEIRRVQARLKAAGLERDVQIAPLYGNLSQENQDWAILPNKQGLRKIVLATSIAETSITVEGVRVVVDSGLMRVPRFSPRTGMTRLATVPVSLAAADQRRGRAGRLGPGICYRLWTRQQELRLEARTTPEILAADLAALALELAAWGTVDPAEFSWIDPPPPAAFSQALELLRQLGAIDRNGTITPHGRCMAESGLHPRLAHMILKAKTMGLGGLACELAALLSERDLLREDEGIPDADLRLRVEWLHSLDRFAQQGAASFQGYTVDLAACRRIIAEVDYFKRQFGVSTISKNDIDYCGLLLAFAYPDRIAQRRTDGRFLLRNGRGAVFATVQSLSEQPFLVAVELDDQGPESRIFLAAPVDLEDLVRYFGEQGEQAESIFWDRAAHTVRARMQQRLGALLLADSAIAHPEPEAVLAALLQGIKEEGLEILPWTLAARQFRQRLQFIGRLQPGWPDMSDEALMATLKDWLGPYLYGLKSREDLQRLNLAEILAAMLTREQCQKLDEYAPKHIVVPSGQLIPIDYSNAASPVLAVRLQEMFGLEDTPSIVRGTVRLTLHLLSPAHRPVQVTSDLASFWRNTYFEVRKELAGRYPKHYWPDDPLHATPTSRTRPRS